MLPTIGEGLCKIHIAVARKRQDEGLVTPQNNLQVNLLARLVVLDAAKLRDLLQLAQQRLEVALHLEVVLLPLESEKVQPVVRGLVETSGRDERHAESNRMPLLVEVVTIARDQDLASWTPARRHPA